MKTHLSLQGKPYCMAFNWRGEQQNFKLTNDKNKVTCKKCPQPRFESVKETINELASEIE